MTFNELIPFVAVCAAAVTALSTLAGIRLANRAAETQLRLRLNHEDVKERNVALRARLEELYQLVELWAGEIVGHHITYRAVMLGRISYNDALDITLKKEFATNLPRMFMLGELYFPEAHSLLTNLKNARDVAAEVQGEFKVQYRENGLASPLHVEKLDSALKEFNSAVDGYKQALAKHAREV